MSEGGYEDFKNVDDALSMYGYGIGELSPIAMNIVDGHGLRPGDPKIMRRVVGSLLNTPDSGAFGEPLIKAKDFRLDEETEEPVPFGYLEGHETYGSFDVVPWMGISNKPGQVGLVDTLDDCDFFRDHNDSVDEKLTALCESNRSYTYEPITMVSSTSYKIVNDAIKNFEVRFQSYAKRVLVLGSGSNTLCTTFDFSTSDVWYVDDSMDNLKEISRRFGEMGHRPAKFKLVCATFEKMRHKHKDVQFDLIIANNSLHWIAQGCPKNQRTVLARVLDMLADKGALIGVCPSLSGMSSTPYSFETRNPDGLYCITPKGDGSFEAQSLIGNVHYREPVLFTSLLYGLEAEKGGRAEISHLSSWVSSKQSGTMMRCYECFSFVKGNVRPEGVVVSTVCEDHTKVGVTDLCSIAISGRTAETVKVKVEKTSAGFTVDRTLGVCIGAHHIPNLLFHSPLLVSEKLDGTVGELSVNEEGSWIIRTRDYDILPDVPKPKPGSHSKTCIIVEVFINGDKCTVWWLESYWIHGRPPSWLAGLRGFPQWIGVKSYSPLSTKAFLKLVSSQKPGESDGVVILNAHDQFGGFRPKHMFFKSKMSVDVALNGQVYEFFRDKAVKRDHDQNGAMRIFEAPFLLSDRVIISLLTSRHGIPDTFLGDAPFLNIDEIFSYPYSVGSLERCRQRNTALVQFWRGMVDLDETSEKLVSLVVPLSRHQDWGLFGVLENGIYHAGYDKDLLLPDSFFGAGKGGKSVGGSGSTVQASFDDDDLAALFAGDEIG